MKEPRVAVYAGTRNLYDDMVPAVNSLLHHDGADKVILMIEDDEFPHKMPECVEFMNVSRQTLFDPNGPNFNNGWTYMVLMRGALAKLVPDADKVLSLDVDTIVDGDISELWDLPIDNYYLAGAREPGKSKNNGIYVQMGVVLFNLKKIREDSKDDEIVHALNTQHYLYTEQDCINQVCHDWIYRMDSKFNANDWTDPTDHPIIHHFAAIKEWQHFPIVQKYR